MVEIAVSHDVLTLVVTLLITLLTGSWTISAMLHTEKDHASVSGFDIVMMLVACSSAAVAVILAFMLAISAGVSHG